MAQFVWQGISFLDAKNEFLGQYNVDVANLVASKASGKSIEDNPSVGRLIQMRTVGLYFTSQRSKLKPVCIDVLVVRAYMTSAPVSVFKGKWGSLVRAISRLS